MFSSQARLLSLKQRREDTTTDPRLAHDISVLERELQSLQDEASELRIDNEELREEITVKLSVTLEPSWLWA